jgi:hypothetical protein
MIRGGGTCSFCCDHNTLVELILYRQSLFKLSFHNSVMGKAMWMTIQDWHWYLYFSTAYHYSSILYTVFYSIPTPPYYTLSFILSLLIHTVHYHTFYPNSSILYTILHSISTPQCTVWKSRDIMYDSVKPVRVVIECKLMYSKEE